jgi:hypothetical protein
LRSERRQTIQFAPIGRFAHIMRKTSQNRQ